MGATVMLYESQLGCTGQALCIAKPILTHTLDVYVHVIRSALLLDHFQWYALLGLINFSYNACEVFWYSILCVYS